MTLLKGEGLPPEEADEQRERLLAGFRWILVDEYQDIGAQQYELISALAGRTLNEEDKRLSLFAVGDDDQNIYAFNGASVEFIRRFEADYAARPVFLIENYRSTAHIIGAANRIIQSAVRRMKAEHPIIIDRARKRSDPGGDWQRCDPVGRGRVQVLPAGDSPLTQAVAVMTEFERLAAVAADWDWSHDYEPLLLDWRASAARPLTIRCRSGVCVKPRRWSNGCVATRSSWSMPL